MTKTLLMGACLGLLLFGCDPETSGGFQRPDAGPEGGAGGEGGVGGVGGEGGAGAAGGEGGAGGDGGMGGVGGEGGGEGGMGGEGGVGGEGGMGGGEGGMGGGEGGMGGMGGGDVPMGPTPTYAQAASATVGERTYVAWSVEGTVWLRIIDFDGDFTGPAEPLAELDAAWVSALTVDGIPWIVYGAADGNLFAAKGDEPEAAALDLGLTGRPLLAQLGRRLMIIAAGGDGPAHQLLTGEPGEVVGEPTALVGLPMPGSASQVAGGVVLRYDTAGQCVFVDDGDGEPTGNFPCQAGDGRLLTDGARALISYESVEENNTLMRLVPTFGFDDSFILGGVNDASDLLGFQNDNGVRAMPVLARLPSADDRQGLTELLLVEPERLRRSDVAWNGWPHPTARVVVGRADEALVLVFGTDDDPRVERVAMSDYAFDDRAYSFEYDESCVPDVEVCDGEDQDCDGDADNGLCCNNSGAGEAVGFGLPNQNARPQQWLLADLRIPDGYYFAARVEDDYWVTRHQRLERDMNTGDLLDTIEIPGTMAVRGAYEGHSFHSAGGHAALIARNAEDQWTIFWHYRLRVADPPVKEPEVIPCDQILAADTHAHEGVNSVLIACPDRYIISYPRVGQETEVVMFADLDIERAEWVTLTRTGLNLLTMLIGHLDSLGSPRISAFTVPVNGNLRAIDLPDDVEALDELAPHASVRRTVQIGDRPYIQIREATDDTPLRMRAQVKRGSDWEWVELLSAPNPTRARFAQTVSKLVVSGPIGTEEAPETGFWVINITDNDELNLWSTEPAFTWPGPEPLYWDVGQGNYDDYIVLFVEPEPGSALHRFVSRRVECELR